MSNQTCGSQKLGGCRWPVEFWMLLLLNCHGKSQPVNPETASARPQQLLTPCLLFSLLLLAMGCQTPNCNFSRIINEPAPLPEAMRASFGKVGVLPESVVPEPDLPKPMGTAETMGLVAVGTLVGFHKTVNPKDDPRGIPFELIYGPPLAITAGILGGLFVGVPEHQQRAAENAIRSAIREEPLERGLQARIHGLAGEQRRKNLLPLDESATAELKDHSPTNFQALASSGLDSVLLVRMVHHRFEAPEGINPEMAFAVEANIKLIRVTDGQVLTKSQLAYRSQRRSFVDWGLHDAKRLRSELETARNLFAEIILEQYFGSAEK
jgi:hypothetical protein